MRCVITLKSTDGAGTGVSVGGSTGVGVGAGGGVFAGTGVSVGAGTGVSVGSGVSVGLVVGVGTGVLVAVLVGIGVSVGVLVAVAVAGGLGVLVGVGVILAMVWQPVIVRASRAHQMILRLSRPRFWSRAGSHAREPAALRLCPSTLLRTSSGQAWEPPLLGIRDLLRLFRSKSFMFFFTVFFTIRSFFGKRPAISSQLSASVKEKGTLFG
jgi:hypothetical protein